MTNCSLSHSLLRVEFSFGYDMDELLNVDIKKSRILLIGELAEFIIKFLGAPFREANKTYRDNETKSIHLTGTEAHHSSNQNIESKAPDVEEAKVTQNGENSAKVEKHSLDLQQDADKLHRATYPFFIRPPTRNHLPRRLH